MIVLGAARPTDAGPSYTRPVSYDVVGLLGRGAMAVVELAVDGEGRHVATKRLALGGSGAQIHIARQRLRREAEILGGLAHPGIVPVLEVIDDGADVVLILPALAESLADRVARLGPLPPAEVARIGRTLIDALAAAHRQGVVHRDIKPANVLFDPAGRPALADFGVAVTRELTAGLTLTGAVVGTPTWMAPEQARGEPAGPASDVFSLAATLAFAATGEGPYGHGEPHLLLGRAAREEIRPVPDAVPTVLRRPLQRMLDPRPEHRPAAAAVLGGLSGTLPLLGPNAAPPHPKGEDAARALRRIAVRALAGRQPPAPSRRTRRRRAVLWTLLATVLVAAAVAVVAVGTSATGGVGQAARVAHHLSRRPTPPACRALPYQPCGQLPAAHTDGHTCQAGWYDLDGLAANGCEAHSDYVAHAALLAGVPLRANVVPTASSDVFDARVDGHLLNLCWGSLHVTLTAPTGTAEQVTVSHGGRVLSQALSANGAPATATVAKPSCFGSDRETVQVTVKVAAAGTSSAAQDFTLTRDAGW